MRLGAWWAGQESNQDANELSMRLAEQHANANHRALYGAEDMAQKSEAEDMQRQNIFGDVQYPTPVFMPAAQKSGIGPLAAVAAAGLLGGGGLGLGLAAPYLLDKLTPDEQPPPIVQPGTDETVSIGFGKVDGGIAEYLEANP